MAEERLGAALQLSVIATLCYDQSNGSFIAAHVSPDHFDGGVRDFVRRVLIHRKKYGGPPGPTVIEDIAAQSNLGKRSANLLEEIAVEGEALNGEYAASRVNDFIRRQTIKGALLDATERYQHDDETMVADVERLLSAALRTRVTTFDAGMRLTDPDALRFTEANPDVVSLGIRELDRYRIGLRPKQVLLYVAPKGSGKTWFCVHCAKQALLQRQRVVHYSLEETVDQMVPRYYQALFGVAEDGERFARTHFEFDELGRLAGFKTRSLKPKLDFTQPGIRKWLAKQIKQHGTRFGNLIIKDFPTGSLTIDQMVGHLDYLQDVEGFVPNVIILDYPKLMRMDRKNLRVDLGRTFEEFRGVLVARNMAGVAPHQGNRASIGARRVHSTDAGEDISVVQTADVTLAYSRTEAEEKLGLGRLSVEHVRRARGGANVLLSQSYDTGQYVLSSALMQSVYWDKLREVGGNDSESSD